MLSTLLVLKRYDGSMTKRRIIIIAVCLFVLIGGAVGGWFITHPTKSAAPANPAAKTTPKAAAALDPLTIPAIRTKSYPGSPITVEQDLGNQGGYSNQVGSYLSDGLKIYALISTPDGTPPTGGWPVIILDHGYVDPSQYRTASNDYQSIIATFARAGYMVVKPDYRGHGSSQGVAEGGHFSPVYAYDNLNLIASLKQYPPANAKRIALFGHSLGGHVALRTVVVSPDIKATVLMAGVVGSINDILYNWPNSPMPGDQPTATVTGVREALLKKYGTPKTNPDFWNSASAINYVDAITGPVQVNQDAGDSVVPKLFADNLVAALQKANKPVEYFVYPGDDHQFVQNRALFLQRALAFYKANL